MQLEQKKSSDIRVSPHIRLLAKQMDIDLTSISATGSQGQITEDDLFQFANLKTINHENSQTTTSQSHQLTQGENFERYGEIEKLKISKIRMLIANQMKLSAATIPHVTHQDDSDVTELWNILQELKVEYKEKGIHFTLLPFVIKAMINSLKEFPLLNATFDEQSQVIIVKKYYNIGIATATQNGLLVPNIKQADQKSILALTLEITDNAEKARNGKSTLDDLKGGSITITNYGSIGGKYASPIINYPEVAILGLGRIYETPGIKDGKIIVKKFLPLSLSFDHRIVDGAYVAQFVNKIINYLENPFLLLSEKI